MTAEIMINKVVITEEAKFDYEEVVARQPIPKTAIKNECELYIDNLQKGGRLLYGYYFRAKYYDENSDKMLMLFFYKGERFGKMQLWKLSGICEADDWTEEQEDDGQIRNWLKSKIADFEDRVDWVIELRLWEEMKIEEMNAYGLAGLDKEVKNAITNGGYDAYSEKYDHLSHDDGKWNGKPRHKKPNRVSRK